MAKTFVSLEISSFKNKKQRKKASKETRTLAPNLGKVVL
jgi:hypothetical protein